MQQHAEASVCKSAACNRTVSGHGQHSQRLACLIEQGIRAPGDAIVGGKCSHALGVEEGVGLLECRGIVIVHRVQDPHEQHSSYACQEG